MKQEIDHRLSYNSDRSKWIVDAIRTKLKQIDDGDDALSHASLTDLLLEIQYRASESWAKDIFSRGDRERITEWVKQSKILPESGE